MNVFRKISLFKINGYLFASNSVFNLHCMEEKNNINCMEEKNNINCIGKENNNNINPNCIYEKSNKEIDPNCIYKGFNNIEYAEEKLTNFCILNCNSNGKKNGVKGDLSPKTTNNAFREKDCEKLTDDGYDFNEPERGTLDGFNYIKLQYEDDKLSFYNNIELNNDAFSKSNLFLQNNISKNDLFIQDNNSTYEEISYDVLYDKYQHRENKNIFEYNGNTYKFVNDYICIHKKKGYKIVTKANGDGNCMFRLLSSVIFNTEDYHKEIRNYIYDNILKKLGKEALEAISLAYDFNNVDAYIDHMKRDKEWGNIEAYTCFAKLFGINIFVNDIKKDTNKCVAIDCLSDINTSEFISINRYNDNHYGYSLSQISKDTIKSIRKVICPNYVKINFKNEENKIKNKKIDSVLKKKKKNQLKLNKKRNKKLNKENNIITNKNNKFRKILKLKRIPKRIINDNANTKE